MKIETAFCILCISVVQGQLTVISLPAVLFNEGSQSIVEGSVIWLYCEVDSISPSLRVTWNKDNVPLTQDVPHILMRSSSTTSSSTFLLVVDNFQSSDDGAYQCTAEDGAMTGNGSTLILTASTSSPGSLQIITNDAAITSGIPPDNRTGYEVGDVASFNFVIGHVNDDTTMYAPPTVLWLKDGNSTRTTPTNTPVGSNGRLNTTLSFSFQESDAGVYQCVFTGTNSELFITIPIRLDTGETLTLRSVSPTAIVLRPPEKLVLEVRSMGRYNFIEWSRNGASFVSGGAFRPQIPEEFPHFYEIYVHEPTNTSDLGLYEVDLVPSQGQQATNEVEFSVISPVDPNTTIVGRSVETVVEGGSVDISCISTGVPVPIITWKFNNQITSFSQTDVSTDFSARVIRQGGTIVPELTRGNIVSTLHIENTQYPAHNGVYECIGNNSDDTSVSNIAMITVQVEVIPEVDVTADVIRVAVGGDVNLTCTVTRGNPMIYTYTWTNVDTSITLSDETSANLTLSSIIEEEIATYRCDVTNSVGTGSDTITIEQAFPPVVSSRINPPGPVVLGSTVDLVCETSVGDLPIDFTWTDPNGVSVNPTDTDGTISITLSTGDNGTYTCTATNAVGMNTAVVDVVLAVPPVVVPLTPSQRVIANVSESAVLSFRIDDAVPPVMTSDLHWYYTASASSGVSDFSSTDFQEITNLLSRTSTSSLSYSDDMLTLTVSGIVQALMMGDEIDAGRYFLRASNPGGEDSSFIDLVVYGPPQIVGDPQDQFTINNGSSAVFVCDAIADPPCVISWSFTNSSGSEISEIISTRDTDTANNKYTINVNREEMSFGELTVNNVTFEDRGTYKCTASNVFGEASAAANLTIHVPEPSVTISGSPINDHFYTGLQLNLTCQVEFILPVDTELRLSTLWMKAHSNINSDRITVLGSERVSLNPMKYDSLLIFSPLSITSDDEGIYICSVSATLTQNSAYLEEPPDVMTNRTIMIEIMMFQLRFPITSECSIWIDDNPISKAEDIAANIVNELRPRCQCDFVRDRITNGAFICFSESPRHVTYRAEIHGTLQASTSQLVTHLESWIASNTPISVQAQLLIPDMTCAVAISSPNETECRPVTTVVVSEYPSTATALIIAGIIGIVLFVGAILLIVTTIIIILRHRRITVKNTTQDTFSNPAVQLSTISHSGHDTQSQLYEDNEYDYISFRNRPTSEGMGESCKGGEYSFVECVAYSTNRAVKSQGSACEEVLEKAEVGSVSEEVYEDTTSVKLEGTTECSVDELYDDII